jgi:hypothetical protein
MTKTRAWAQEQKNKGWQTEESCHGGRKAGKELEVQSVKLAWREGAIRNFGRAFCSAGKNVKKLDSLTPAGYNINNPN